MKEAKEFIEKNIIDNEPVILALSGGPDSMCLLNLLLTLKKNVIALHINHNTRQSCDDEYIFLKNYAKEKDFILGYFKLIIKPITALINIDKIDTNNINII